MSQFIRGNRDVPLLLFFLFAEVFAVSDSSDSFITGILSGSSKSPYRLHLQKEIAIFASGISLMLASNAVTSNIKNYSEADLARFSKENVNPFDRNAVGPSSEAFSNWSYVTNAALTNAVWLLFLDKKARDDVLKIVTMYAEAHVLYPLVTLWINPLIARKRPFFYSEKETAGNRLKPFAQTSFPSGHANYGFCFAVLFGNLFNEYFPDSQWRYVVWPLALGCATTTAALRYAGHWHYPTDLIAGAATGSLIGWFIPHIHKKKKREQITFRPVLGEYTGLNVCIDLFTVNRMERSEKQ